MPPGADASGSLGSTEVKQRAVAPKRYASDLVAVWVVVCGRSGFLSLRDPTTRWSGHPVALRLFASGSVSPPGADASGSPGHGRWGEATRRIRRPGSCELRAVWERFPAFPVLRPRREEHDGTGSCRLGPSVVRESCRWTRWDRSVGPNRGAIRPWFGRRLPRSVGAARLDFWSRRRCRHWL